MSTLIVVGFKKDMYRASSVLNRLLEMDYDWVIDLGDAVRSIETITASCGLIRATSQPRAKAPL